MFSRKSILFTLIASAVCVAAGCTYHFYFSQEKTPAPVVFTGWEPKLPTLPALIAMEEESGELTRVVRTDSSTGKPRSIEVGYKDGRSGVYGFSDGKFKSYKSFDEAKNLRYEAEYEPNGLISCYKFFRANGTVESQFRRMLSGVEELSFMNKDGVCIKSVVTASDGSQTVSTRKDASSAVEVTLTKAEASEKNFVPIVRKDGGEDFRLKVKLAGVRVTSWEYRDSSGMLMHSGAFTSDGNVEITLFTPQGKAAIKQIWTCASEDWSRKIYKLSSLVQLNGEGQTSGIIKLYADGVTPMEVSNFYSGYKNSTEHFDHNGFQLRTEYFDSNGSPTSSYETPVQYRRQAKLPPQILAEPGDLAGPAYRLKGMPYSSPMPDASQLTPFFVLPR